MNTGKRERERERDVKKEHTYLIHPVSLFDLNYNGVEHVIDLQFFHIVLENVPEMFPSKRSCSLGIDLTKIREAVSIQCREMEREREREKESGSPSSLPFVSSVSAQAHPRMHTKNTPG